MKPGVTDDELRAALEKFSAQLGEVAWHSITIDDGFSAVGNEHTDFVARFLRDNGLLSLGRPARFLEVSPYLHTTAQALNRDFRVDAAACDISPHSLRYGDAHFRKHHSQGAATLVAADFHELPFCTDYFDVVFIASAVHHTAMPERVLSELVRVARPGGFVILYNEPVGSDGCFYSFRSNRLDALAPWERSLADAGLLRIISSPFPGSRSEQLFGMMENDRIPLDVYLGSEASVAELSLIPLPGSLDAEFELTHADAGAIAQEIDARLAGPRAALGRFESLMDFRLPDAAEVREFATRYAAGLRVIDDASEPDKVAAKARLYGATLQMVLQKPGDAPASGSMLPSGIDISTGVVLSPAIAGGVNVRLADTTLPRLEPRNAAGLGQFFPLDQWCLLDQGSAYAHCLIGEAGLVKLPRRRDARGILLLRYYAVARPEGPYWVDVFSAGHLLDSAPICQSESRLLKLALPEGCDELRLALRPDAEVAMPFSLALRVAYLDVIFCDKAPSPEMAMKARVSQGMLAAKPAPGSS
ncbi:MAG: class I SAM-dependent methyltransferase [Pseudomonadota bacterium]